MFSKVHTFSAQTALRQEADALRAQLVQSHDEVQPLGQHNFSIVSTAAANLLLAG